MESMKTIVEQIDFRQMNMDIITRAGEILRAGGLVAFPTETVYGLGADALNEQAAKKIYAAKGRPSDNPLIVHIADMEALPLIVKRIPEAARRLADKYWPGPLTMIFEKADCVPKETTGGLNTVAVRMPADRIARAMITAAGGYVAAPSSNRSGRPSPTTARHVIEDMDGRVEMIIDGGDTQIGLESTIIDLTGGKPEILRPGSVTEEMVKEAIGSVETQGAVPEDGAAPKGSRHEIPSLRPQGGTLPLWREQPAG